MGTLRACTQLIGSCVCSQSRAAIWRARRWWRRLSHCKRRLCAARQAGRGRDGHRVPGHLQAAAAHCGGEASGPGGDRGRRRPGAAPHIPLSSPSPFSPPTIGGNFGPRPPGSHAALSPAMHLSAVTLPAILFGASYMTGTGSVPSPLDTGCTPPPRGTGCYPPPPLGSSYDTRRECTDRPRPSQFMVPQCMGRTARSTDAVQERDCKSAIWPCSDMGVGPGQNRGLPSVAEFFLVRTHHLHLHCIR